MTFPLFTTSHTPSPHRQRRCAWRSTALGLMLAAVLLFAPAQLRAQETAADGETSRRHLLLITKQIMVLQQEIDDYLKKASGKKDSKKVINLQTQIDRMLLDFESMATQLSLEDPSLQKKKKLDWVEEIQELTKPLLNAVRDLTKKPRMIEELKEKIENLQAKLALHEEASANLSRLLEDFERNPPPDTEAGRKFQDRILRLRNKYDPELVRLNLIKAQRNLEQILSTDESVVDAATKTIKDFVKNRGRNLLVTIAMFIGLWWVLSRLRKWILARKFLSSRTSSIGKLFSAAYNFVVLLFCLLVGLACLYFFNDWLLITLIIMGLFLVVWTSRQWIPRFLQEIKLIVNLGTVKENERLIWKGVPWLVEEIRLQATLVNERLEGGELKLPLHELIGQHSRPVVEHEPWFPTRTGDWVILSDSSYGRVESQTMEQVVLKLKGGALKFYPTPDFLTLNPVNISNGFRYTIEFGLDYGVQAKVTDALPRLFEEGLQKHLKRHFEGSPPDFTFLEVSFDHAGSSSLNIMIIVHVDGRCAARYEENKREVQSTLVRICNENDLTIPFNRLTIDLANGNAANPLTPAT